jgi:hypothetical protein
MMLSVAVVLAGCRPSETKPAPTQSPKQEQPDEEALPPAEPQPEFEREARPEPPDEPPAEAQPEQAVEPEPGPPAEAQPEPEPPLEPEVDTEAALGPPLVDEPDSLKRLDPVKPIWIDQKNKQVVMVGQVCQRNAPLEMFACLKNTKEHEAIVTVDVEAFKAHAGLLAVGAEVGRPVKWNPEYVPATGTEIEVSVVWKDEQGERRTARAQDWILDIETETAMTHPWVFAGSGFWEDERTGEKHYMAESGDFICVSNFPTAMLDLPIESSQANDALMFRAFTERIPPLGTPVTLVLRPKLAVKQAGD